MRTLILTGLILLATSALGCAGNPTVPPIDNGSQDRAGTAGSYTVGCTCGYDAQGIWRIDPFCRDHGIQTYKSPKRLGS